ncbi:MAG: recombinase family protein [Ruminococcaceae bacterium]|nr:recombinase family protein [Oscillospiraceae bacterium]
MAIALYARKSIERENSISCETQLEYCRAMIKPAERGEKILTFVDDGFSGGIVNRDGFQNMMRKIEQGKISKVLVYRLDRISRSLFFLFMR